MGFTKSLREGKVGENLILSLLIAWGVTATLNDKPRQFKWDILCLHNSREIKLEIKNDLYAKKSGNIAIEYYNPKGKHPSGLMETQADIWVHVIQDEPYFCDVPSLKQFLVDVPPLRDIKRCGDGNAAIKLYTIDSVVNTILKPFNQEVFLEHVNA